MGLGDDIRELDKLFDENLLTCKEYKKAKANLLQRCATTEGPVQPDRRGSTAEDTVVLTLIQKAESRVDALEKTKERCQAKIDLLEEFSNTTTRGRRDIIRGWLKKKKVFVGKQSPDTVYCKLAELKKEKDNIIKQLVSAQDTYSYVLRETAGQRVPRQPPVLKRQGTKV